MSAKHQPVLGVHLLRTSILRAVAEAHPPLRGSDIVAMFATSGWVMPPTIKDVRHAVRWLETRELVEWRKALSGAGKHLHPTSAGHEAASLGLPGAQVRGSRC